MSNTPEPFGYFKAEPFGWTDCAETDECAKPLYDKAAIRLIQKQRDETLFALEGLHKVCEIALQGKDGKQHTYFETRAGHFVEATKAMLAAETAISGTKG